MFGIVVHWVLYGIISVKGIKCGLYVIFGGSVVLDVVRVVGAGVYRYIGGEVISFYDGGV